jgi:hypothetical protein
VGQVIGVPSLASVDISQVRNSRKTSTTSDGKLILEYMYSSFATASLAGQPYIRLARLFYDSPVRIIRVFREACRSGRMPVANFGEHPF